MSIQVSLLQEHLPCSWDLICAVTLTTSPGQSWHSKAQVSTAQVCEWSLLTSHTLWAASKEWDIISIATAQSWGSVLDQFLPWVCARHSQDTAWLWLNMTVSMNHDLNLNFTGKTLSSASVGQGCCRPAPRNICWFAKSSQTYRQEGLLPGTFISWKIHVRCFGETNALQDYTEPDLNKSKF